MTMQQPNQQTQSFGQGLVRLQGTQNPQVLAYKNSIAQAIEIIKGLQDQTPSPKARSGALKLIRRLAQTSASAEKQFARHDRKVNVKGRRDQEAANQNFLRQQSPQQVWQPQQPAGQQTEQSYQQPQYNQS